MSIIKRYATEDYVESEIDKINEAIESKTSEIYVGSEEPIDPNVDIWINPDGEPNYSGGAASEGVLELIDSFTLEEDVMFERTAEPDGTPYSFTILFVIIKTKAVSTLGFNLNFKYGNGSYSPPLWVTGVTGNTDGSEWIGYVEASWQNGLWRNRFRPCTKNNYIFNIQENSNIAAVKTLSGVRTSMPVSAGTTIEIWGVRADA